ncbi:DUF2975 domain-containing protein [Glycomyces niveus]|uniref:DUF2975 domain-containing protein n=1 Tax=Glycomyces niveus TaxID=2820287 RepID=A0ABS3U652_9ACTN|nr:DUF2975 domain-containing protein [Glycomyces sp. NEAU-S30]MBO3734249.1 DUF2975 domain-containing protein [Glycomyces sp. NEAU-S30]
MNKLFTIALRAALAATFLFSLFGQILVIPNSVVDELRRYLPPQLVVAYATLGILGVVCIQVAMGAVWKLLAMVEQDAIFTPNAFRWIDAIIGASVAAALLSFAVAVHLMFINMDEMAFLGAWLLAVACGVAGACLAMLMTIMRGLLRKATDLESEMAEVV